MTSVPMLRKRTYTSYRCELEAELVSRLTKLWLWGDQWLQRLWGLRACHYLLTASALSPIVLTSSQAPFCACSPTDTFVAILPEVPGLWSSIDFPEKWFLPSSKKLAGKPSLQPQPIA